MNGKWSGAWWECVELLEDVPEESDTRTDLQDVVARSYLDPTFTSKWCPVLTQRITNKALQDQFEGIACCML